MGRRDPAARMPTKHNSGKCDRIPYRTHLDPYHLYVPQGILVPILMIRWLTCPHLDQATFAYLLRYGTELTRALYGIPAKLS